jgi:hypothetical protein
MKGESPLKQDDWSSEIWSKLEKFKLVQSAEIRVVTWRRS